ncbi:DNA methyltransferase [Ktedonosporobacter rubrisoli]|uniref:site-specific DNA-methyltransferase (adenine-specific) n=1 Tax=Ktedonosporobacter rubrisoli TaxID=2509675 RepID=A0A4P6K5K4_KTERU|nr:type ISP restriction/modification enzyme [Ktedonosporobacter rubrisoli]QBD82826.1 DNA methyltransferase [Ktedonosporobacter rubrisoli]
MREGLMRSYLRHLEIYYTLGRATEISYRSALQKLLEELLSPVSIRALNEPKREKCGAPDYAVLREDGQGYLTIGHVETKNIGTSLDMVECTDQMSRYLRAIDNLVLTNYLEFRWYVKGERRMVAQLATLQGSKSLLLQKSGPKNAGDLLCSFLEHHAEMVYDPKDLAARMARLAHIIRDIIVAALEENEVSNIVRELYEAFKSILIPDQPITEFADMFAQTLVYGIFAARCNYKSKKLFRREDAAKAIPRSNPFLRDLFTLIDAKIDDEPFAGFIDELVQLLAVADMDALFASFGQLTRQEDPIIHFYETFLSEYDPQLRELRGIYYTPTPIVSYIVRSVDYLLRKHFECSDGLADTSTIQYTYIDELRERQIAYSPRVLILDPACGTGTFLYAIINYIRQMYRQMGNAGMWSGYVHEHLLPRLFGFELMMAPYVVAHLKLGMQLAALDLPVEERDDWTYTFESGERLGLYLTNTLEQRLSRSKLLLGSFISDEANAAAKVKSDYPVMVIIGNPPYSGHSANDGPWITNLLHGIDTQSNNKKEYAKLAMQKVGNYFAVDEGPLHEKNPKWLNDDYVKFIRFAQWRIEQTGYGILAFVTNHGYLDNPTFRGMRQSLMHSFDEIYVLDLHGSSKRNELFSHGVKDENVFDIQTGVAIGIFVKQQVENSKNKICKVYHAHLWGARDREQVSNQDQPPLVGKYPWLLTHDITTTGWVQLSPEAPFYLFVPQESNRNLRMEYERGKKLTEIMPVNVLGFQTHRDHFAVDFDEDSLYNRISEMLETRISDKEYTEKYKLSNSASWQIAEARKALRSDRDWQKHFLRCLYRPFDWRYCYFSYVAMDRPRRELLEHVADKSNLCLLASRQQATTGYRHTWVTREVANDCVISTTSREANQAFPLYLYPNRKSGELFEADEHIRVLQSRRPNLSSPFVTDLSKKISMQFIGEGQGDLLQSFGAEDIFHYIYAILHSPTYRIRYSEFLKMDFPRLPVTSDANLFRKLCRLGDLLVGLHLMEKIGQVITRYPIKGNNVVEKIEYKDLSSRLEQGCVYINKTQYFEDVPPEVWKFQVGGHQVCLRWLKYRQGRSLSFDDIQHYQRIVAALRETIQVVERIDETIEEQGGWPIR